MSPQLVLPFIRRPALRVLPLVPALCVAGLLAPSSSAAFSIESAEVGTCTLETCTYASEPSAFFTQAAGRSPFGLTAFSVKANGEGIPEGDLKHVRVDLPPGTSFNPFALERCPESVIREGEAKITSKCPNSQVGKVEYKALASKGNPEKSEKPTFFSGSVPLYNVEPPPGRPLELAFAPVGIVHLVLGGVSWHHEPALEAKAVTTGDYHEYFESEVPDFPQVVSFKFIVNGRLGKGFLTIPSECTSNVTSHLVLESYGHSEATEQVPEGTGSEVSEDFTTTPVGPANCQAAPLEPAITVAPSTTKLDQPDAASVDIRVPHTQAPTATEIDSSAVRSVRLTLPPGMTLNPAAAAGLEACTNEQFGAGSAEPIGCPENSRIGTFSIETPVLPPESLSGNVYVGQPLSGNPQSGQEYRIFLDAASAKYDLDFRFEGQVSADPATGQLTTALVGLPQLPFTDAMVHLDGPHVPLANPLICGPATATSELQAYAGYPGRPAATPTFTFPYGLSGEGTCPSAVPFSPVQAAASSPATAGASGAFTFSLAREGGEQYLDELRTTLPAGLLARIPSATLCPEAQANAGACPASSQIGTVLASLGSGTSPLQLPGAVYLTGPYDGAPYGLSIAVSAEHVGPYDYGVVVTRARIDIDPYTTRVTVSTPGPGAPGAIPLIVGGAPLRLRSITLSMNRPGFMLNPTSCTAQPLESAVSGTPTLPPGAGATVALATPFQASDCSSLSFKPSFAASTSAKTSRANGASLQVSLSPHSGDANLREVAVSLPSILPSRQSTLKEACTEAQFNANPGGCPAAARVASATLQTPLLPAPLSGAGILVSRGGGAFPDLDFVLEGNGVRLIQVSHTNIRNGITSSTFPSLPDAPFTSFKATFPTGTYSLLAANGDLCAHKVTTRTRVLVRRQGKARRRHGRLVYRTRKVTREAPLTLTMPTTLVAQNGARVTQSTRIAVAGCAKSAVKVRRVRVRGHTALLTVALPAAGRARVSGRYARSVSRRVRKASTVTLRATLSAAGARALQRRHPLRLRLEVAFTATTPSGGSSHVFVTSVFRG